MRDELVNLVAIGLCVVVLLALACCFGVALSALW